MTDKKYYYGLINGTDWGFIDDTDNRVTPDMIELTEEEWQALLDGQAEGQQIVGCGGKCFLAEQGRYYLDDNNNWQLRTDDDYQAYLNKKEQERINALTLTKRVFALALQELGITYTQLKELIATDEQAQLEWGLCVELERSNPLLDIMAGKIGITSQQLDYIFKKGNGEDV